MCGSNGTYLGNGGSCYDGMLYEATDPSYSDPYGSYGSYGGYCVANGTWVCNDIYGDPAACPSSYGPAARVAADQEVAVAQNGRSAQCRPKGTCGLENINGTFNLPLNSAFSGERVNATTGIPVDLDAARWKPIVQFHFIRANSANDFVEYRRRPGASGFPANNDRVTLLGVQRNDNRFRLRYSDAVGRLSVNYNSVNNLPQSTNIEQASIHIPPHVAHKLTDLLTPPCGNNC
uniref:Uncharacterized protein n=1 Tax=Tetradesmus obliquus TaxID=3088 RepID=A0A383VE99_TETOB|eukprot:jgi/Sobl393_1/9924/SZX63260.1